MTISTSTTTGLDREDLVRSHLRAVGEEHRAIQARLEESAAQRAQCAAVAREYGLTLQQIADVYGITEGAVRQMLKRGA